MSWLVCAEKHSESLKELLGATDISKGGEIRLCVAVTPEGKLFVFEARERAWTFDRDDERRRLSIGHEVFFCMLDEHVMASEVACWKDGIEIWRAAHDSEEGVYHLDVRGTLPPSFEAIKQARFDEQNREGGEDCGVDFIISVPMDLAAEFTGYDGGIEQPNGAYSEWACPRPSKFKKGTK